MTAGAVAALALALWRPWADGAGASGAFDPRRVGVMYLDASGAEELAYLAESLTEDIIDMLSRVEMLSVIPPSGVLEFRNRDAPLDSVVRKLGVGTLIEGTVREAGDRVRVTLRLTDAVSVRQLDSKTIDAPAGALLALRDGLADSVQQFLRERVGPELRVLMQRAGTESDEAWQLVQRAERARRVAATLREENDFAAAAEALARADSLLERAAVVDPEWMEPVVLAGWTALDRVELAVSRARGGGAGVSRAVREGLAAAAAVGERAVASAPDDPWALELRGTARYRTWDPPAPLPVPDRQTLLVEAERDLRAAVATHPWPARALSTLSDLVRRKGSFDEARVLARRAMDADQYLAATGNSAFQLAQALMDDEQYGEAADLCRETGGRLVDDVRWPLCELTALASIGSGSRDLWRLAGELVGRSRPDARALYGASGQMMVATALARAGLADSGQAVLRRTLAEAPRDEPRLHYYEAAAWLALGRQDAALDALDRLLAAHPQRRAYVASDPWFRALAEVPAFRALVDTTR